MTSDSAPTSSHVYVLLSTGGTIAGVASSPDDDLGYQAGQLNGLAMLGVLRAATPSLGADGIEVEVEDIAQIDSKDMGPAVWQALARSVHRHLARPEVGAVLITHGTDTLEETAYFLQRVLAPTKPVVMTAAMRPATSRHADGPGNLRDAWCVVQNPRARGVVVVMAGTVWSSLSLRKGHTQALDAFNGGEIGAVARVVDGVLHLLGDWPGGTALGLPLIEADVASWPPVEIITSHAGARAAMVDAVVASGARGIVVAGTGNGTVHAELAAGLQRAQAAGVRIVRASRCGAGRVDRVELADDVAGDPALESPPSGPLSPVQARIEVMLGLLGQVQEG